MLYKYYDIDIPVIFFIEKLQFGSFRQQNYYLVLQVHRIDFDDDNNAISKTTFVHADGEVWGISASTVSRNVISTIYNHGKVHSL
jgi:hypothetical protein